jgi:hypothetical protein
MPPRYLHPVTATEAVAGGGAVTDARNSILAWRACNRSSMSGSSAKNLSARPGTTVAPISLATVGGSPVKLKIASP